MSHTEGIISVSEALRMVLETVTTLGTETVPILKARGRVLFDDIVSDTDIPPLNNSAMDGYAVRSADTAGASAERQVRLSVSGEIQAGGKFKEVTVAEKTAVRIMTGAPVPDGADAVIPVEFTEEEDAEVVLFREVKKNENIRFAGEDIARGHTVLRKGDTIRSADIGLLASLNIPDIVVFRRPVAAIISTGDEVVEVGGKLGPGQIRNSNAYTLHSELEKYGAEPRYLGIAGDSMEQLKLAFDKALEYDMVITTGGVSMGKYDYVKDVMRECGVNIMFEKVRMKPGKPLVFGTRGGALLFGLPGNPVSVMISFLQFVRPALLKMSGARNILKPEFLAILDEEIRKKPDRMHFIRGYFTIKEKELHVSMTGPQGSGILRSMSEANCLIIVPEGITRVAAGERVLIQLTGHEEVG